MKTFLIVFFLFAASAYAAAPQTSTIGPPPVKEDYNKSLENLMTQENLSDCISMMDRLIDEGEHGVTDNQPHPGMLEVNTKAGLHLEFSATSIPKEAIIYYLTISRNGLELKYSDTAKFAALFADRAGLPHPVNLSEGDKSIFYGQWLIKPSTWKSMHKMMIKVRTANRAEKDPLKAFSVAIEREMEARAEAIRNR